MLAQAFHRFHQSLVSLAIFMCMLHALGVLQYQCDCSAYLPGFTVMHAFPAADQNTPTALFCGGCLNLKVLFLARTLISTPRCVDVRPAVAFQWGCKLLIQHLLLRYNGQRMGNSGSTPRKGVAPEKLPTDREYTRKEIAAICQNEQQCLVVIANIVFDVKGFLNDHPGGMEVCIMPQPRRQALLE